MSAQVNQVIWYGNNFGIGWFKLYVLFNWKIIHNVENIGAYFNNV